MKKNGEKKKQEFAEGMGSGISGLRNGMFCNTIRLAHAQYSGATHCIIFALPTGGTASALFSDNTCG